ncbi:MAG: Na/Pi symporter [Bacteroidota bacterium]
MAKLNSDDQQTRAHLKTLGEVLLLLLIIYAFLASIELMGVSVRLLGREFADNLIASTRNPFIGLFVGLLATAILQSSSIITSTLVVLTGAAAFGPDGDPEVISQAIPIIMGANIGTTITSTIVSLGHITHVSEYRKAIAAATVHDFFNIFTVLIVFPLELLFGILSKPAVALAQLLYVNPDGGGTLNGVRFVKAAVSPITNGVVDAVSWVTGPTAGVLPYVTLGVALVTLFLALRGITVYFKRVVVGRIRQRMGTVLFGHPFKSLLWGAGITAAFQSSSATTSLIVPLVATKRISLRRAFPFILGANVGTTTTALLAALLAPGAFPILGFAIALGHVLFNLIGVLIFFPFARIRNIPVNVARHLGRVTMSRRFVGVAYLAVVFFLVPFVLIIATTDIQLKKDGFRPIPEQQALPDERRLPNESPIRTGHSRR